MTETTPWHHRPAHVFETGAIYMVTAATLHKHPVFQSDERLSLLQSSLFEVTTAYKWELEAWAIFPNHYHFVAKAPEQAKTLKPMLQRLHSQTARRVNVLDEKKGRQVWFQYWDTCLTYEKSWFARLNYVHHNPVKHGFVQQAEDYPYCSARWFEENTDTALREKIRSCPYDRINIEDDY